MQAVVSSVAFSSLTQEGCSKHRWDAQQYISSYSTASSEMKTWPVPPATQTSYGRAMSHICALKHCGKGENQSAGTSSAHKFSVSEQRIMNILAREESRNGFWIDNNPFLPSPLLILWLWYSSFWAPCCWDVSSCSSSPCVLCTLPPPCLRWVFLRGWSRDSDIICLFILLPTQILSRLVQGKLAMCYSTVSVQKQLLEPSLHLLKQA